MLQRLHHMEYKYKTLKIQAAVRYLPGVSSIGSPTASEGDLQAAIGRAGV